MPRRLILLSAVALLAMSGQVLALEAATVFTEAAAATEGVLPASPPSMRVTDLSVDGLGIGVRYWTDSRRSDFVATTSAIRQAMVDAAHSAGIRFPTPPTYVVPAEGSDLR